MCLNLSYTDSLNAFMAKEPIVCYKMGYFLEGRFLSKYRGFEYVFGKRYKTELLRESSSDYYKSPTVSKGFHSFERMYDAMSDRQMNAPGCENLKHILATCVIPTGSTYYFGKFGYWNAYASDEIIIGSYEFADEKYKLEYNRFWGSGTNRGCVPYMK